MAVQVPKPGSRIGEDDPLCAVKSTKNLLNREYSGHEDFKTEGGHWFERRRENILYSHCQEKDPNRAQQDDGFTGTDWPIRDDPPKPRHGGPIQSDKEAK